MKKNVRFLTLTVLAFICAVVHVDAQKAQTSAPNAQSSTSSPNRQVSDSSVQSPAQNANTQAADSATQSSPPKAQVPDSAAQTQTQSSNAEEIRSLLRTVNFKFNSAALKPDSHKPLDSVAALFKQDDELRYEVQGHTDCKGNPDYNKRLSMARAVSVKNYLVLAGVPAKSIVAIGYGADNPIADNTTEKGRSANRRVEIVLIDCHVTYAEMRKTEAALLEEVRQADIKGFEELDHDVVELPKLEFHPEPHIVSEPEPQPAEAAAAQSEPVDTVSSVSDVTPEPEPVSQEKPAEFDTAQLSGSKCVYLLSVRPELLIVLEEISSLGGVFEFGIINKNGFLLTLDISGGVHYYGAVLNLGYAYTFGKEATAVFGLSGNYHYTDLVVNVEDHHGNEIGHKFGDNKSYAGVFWKILPHKESGVDITNRILFGRRRDSAWYDKEQHEIYYKNTTSVTYSLTVGFTLIKRSK